MPVLLLPTAPACRSEIFAAADSVECRCGATVAAAPLPPPRGTHLLCAGGCSIDFLPPLCDRVESEGEGEIGGEEEARDPCYGHDGSAGSTPGATPASMSCSAPTSPLRSLLTPAGQGGFGDNVTIPAQTLKTPPIGATANEDAASAPAREALPAHLLQYSPEKCVVPTLLDNDSNNDDDEEVTAACDVIKQVAAPPCKALAADDAAAARAFFSAFDKIMQCPSGGGGDEQQSCNRRHDATPDEGAHLPPLPPARYDLDGPLSPQQLTAVGEMRHVVGVRNTGASEFQVELLLRRPCEQQRQQQQQQQHQGVAMGTVVVDMYAPRALHHDYIADPHHHRHLHQQQQQQQQQSSHLLPFRTSSNAASPPRTPHCHVRLPRVVAICSIPSSSSVAGAASQWPPNLEQQEQQQRQAPRPTSRCPIGLSSNAAASVSDVALRQWVCGKHDLTDFVRFVRAAVAAGK